MFRKRLKLSHHALKLFLKYSLLALSVTLCIWLGQVINLNCQGVKDCIPTTQLSPVVASVSPVDSSAQNSMDAIALVQQGRDFYEQEQFTEAARVWQQAAQTLQSQGDKRNQAVALSFLSLAYKQLGQWEEANEAINSSWQRLNEAELQKTKDDQLILAQVLNIRGQLELIRGQTEKALATWEQATATYTQAGDEAGTIGSLINQAQAQQTLGLYLQANRTLAQVGQTLQNQPDSTLKAMGLRSLGNALRVVGNLNKSRQALEQSLAVAQNLQSSSDISAALLGLGNTARAQQDTQTALAYYQQVADVSTSPITRTQAQLNELSLLLETQQLSSARTLGSQLQAQLANLPPSRATVYAQINFAKSLARLKQTGTAGTPSWEEIGQRLAAAIQQAKSLKDQRAEAYALGHLGELYEQTQQLGDAQNLTEQALLIAQSVNAPDIAYRWQWQLGRLHKAQGNRKGAIAAYSDAVKTLQSLRSDLVAINREIQFSFRDEVEPIYRQLVDLLLQPEGISGHTQENLIKARNVIESLQLAELDNFFRTACIEGQPVQIDQVVDQDDPTAAVLYPIILPDRLEVILKLPQQEQLLQYETPVAQDDVEKTLATLRRKLTLPYTLREVQSLSKQVYDWLIQPAEAELAKTQIDTLVFVLDGSLRNIPIAALYDGEQYLVEKYGVALTPGLQLLSPKSLERRELKALTAGLTESRLGFPALTNVAFELEEIQSEVPSTVLLNQEFTNTTLQKEINSVPVPVVHLATHGQFSSNKEETFILTWDGRLDIEGLSRLLRQTDQSRTNAIELLVLSACQTATGDNRATLGLAGVAVRAGARSTLASLWSLDDESSAVLMSQFYRELAADTTRNKAEALRLAQLSLLHNPRYQHPRYWGPFVLVGNWL